MNKVLFITLLVLLSACSSKKTVNTTPVVEAMPTIHQVWQLKSVTGKQYTQEVLNNTEFNLTDSNKAYAYMGCNYIVLNYAIINKISFKTPIMTRKKCNNTMLENDFLVLLPQINNYTIENGVLLLKNQDRVLIMLEYKIIQPL